VLYPILLSQALATEEGDTVQLAIRADSVVIALTQDELDDLRRARRVLEDDDGGD
jgi:hypothetical protein